MLLKAGALVVAVLVGTFVLIHGKASKDAPTAPSVASVQATDALPDTVRRRSVATSRPALSTPRPEQRSQHHQADAEPALVVAGGDATSLPRRFGDWLDAQGVGNAKRDKIYRAIADANAGMNDLFEQFFHAKNGIEMTAQEFGEAQKDVETQLGKAIEAELTDDQVVAFREAFGLPVLLALRDVSVWKRNLARN